MEHRGDEPKGSVALRMSWYMPWMGVHYWGSTANYKWNANGTGKRFGWMIIEYPTGKP